MFPTSITSVAGQLRAGAVEAPDLLELCLERIDRYDSRVRAWVVVDRQRARQEARQCARELAAGRWRGPLQGIPIGIKDLVDVAGLPTEAGSPLRAGQLARRDAPLVQALREAGAVILGKTVTVEFACFDPPPTRNPWDPTLEHTPGGSSSGSAAAVAMGMCLGAIGTQTGGSLVRPASYCGVATCKPTFGRISTDGIVPLSPHLDHPGPIARHVSDLALILDALCPGKAVSPVPMPRPPRLGIVERFFMERVDRNLGDAVEDSFRRLSAAGAQLARTTPDLDFPAILDRHWQIMAVDAAQYHRLSFAARRDAYGPKIAGLLDDGLAAAAVDYADALVHQRQTRRQIGAIFEGLDALVMPATDSTAPARLDTTGPRDFQAPWSYAGVPVVSFPVGLAADGMPAAIQLVGRHGHDWRLLEVAAWCQQALGWNQWPPLLET